MDFQGIIFAFLNYHVIFLRIETLIVLLILVISEVLNYQINSQVHQLLGIGSTFNCQISNQSLSSRFYLMMIVKTQFFFQKSLLLIQLFSAYNIQNTHLVGKFVFQLFLINMILSQSNNQYQMDLIDMFRKIPIYNIKYKSDVQYYILGKQQQNLQKLQQTEQSVQMKFLFINSNSAKQSFKQDLLINIKSVLSKTQTSLLITKTMAGIKIYNYLIQLRYSIKSQDIQLSQLFRASQQSGTNKYINDAKLPNFQSKMKLISLSLGNIQQLNDKVTRSSKGVAIKLLCHVDNSIIKAAQLMQQVKTYTHLVYAINNQNQDKKYIYQDSKEFEANQITEGQDTIFWNSEQEQIKLRCSFRFDIIYNPKYTRCK
ncbi:unnamed protein product (macronuclear) [Paramecium tetraurelia]|uniref:Transmembrane protein n=1 Tax=Paramecium tetraurelia TaxID=5888 RepID=A0BZ78_PARTE|nr:uncharacterized protein GSPATT00033698001 [Paramecium tetraurelia]CAK63845.1 unnamed protein product [Paramecium tetraurelia]|eukprot:XP_001431243.1 hypothetical protein (macronuclear) [Paramecium tetraurelia strain d4-2]